MDNKEISKALNKLKEADKTYSLLHVNTAMLKYIKTVYDETNHLVDAPEMEKVLRENKMDTHLIATEPPKSKGVIFPIYLQCGDPNTMPRRAFQCTLSCRPSSHAMNELLKHHTSYEENYAKLSQSGWITFIKM